MTITEVVRRAAAGSLFTIVVAGPLAGGALGVERAAAAPLACAAGTPVASVPTTAPATPSSPADAAPLPTKPAARAEVNPPGDIPDTQAFVTYRSADGGYAIAMPEGWARTETGPNVVFADKLHRFTVEVACVDTAPTVESATRIDVAALARQVPAFELVSVEAVDVPAGPAILIRYRANSAPDEVTGKQIRLDVDRYELFKDGRLAAISLAAPAGSDNVDVSNRVSRSFRWTA